MKNENNKFIFITGLIRSGTTFTQRLLDSNSNTSVVYQPLTGLFLAVANVYFKELGLENNHPLLDHSSNVNTSDKDFVRWLANEPIKSSLVERELENLHSKVDLNFRAELFSALKRNPQINFVHLWKLLHERILQVSGNGAIGSKEVLAHNFAEALSLHGIQVVHILRNPHDTVLSITQGSHRKALGHTYPLLQLVRIWRRAADFHLDSQMGQTFLSIKLEDLTRNPRLLTDWSEDKLGLPPFPLESSKGIVRDDSGKSWKGNSSFSSETKPQLSLQETKFIDSTLHRQMKQVGYERKTHPSIWSLFFYGEPESDIRKKDLEAYGFSRHRLREEVRFFLSSKSLLNS